MLCFDAMFASRHVGRWESRNASAPSEPQLKAGNRPTFENRHPTVDYLVYESYNEVLGRALHGVTPDTVTSDHEHSNQLPTAWWTLPV